MKEKVDVLIIGGGPAGIVCAVTARKYYPDKKILVIKSIEKGVIPCGIPYMFASLKRPEENALSNASLEKNNIKVVIDEVIGINRNEKFISTKSNNEYHYEKLILATGSLPILPPISGIDKEGIYPVYKDMEYLKKLIQDIKKAKNVLVVGGGFIGVEFADELSNIEGLNVYLVEMLPNLLANSFDPEFSRLAEEKLRSKGVNLLVNSRVEEFIGREKVEKVRLSNGEELDIDYAILGIGATPNTGLAEAAGLDLGKGKGIWVDEYMRTIDPDIFAVGDCAGKRDFFTRKDAPILLASIATAEARIAGANLYQLKVVRENKGTIGIYSTYVDGLVLGTAGHTENSARREGFEIIVGNFEGVDKHPSTMPGASKIKVKLVFSKQSGIILGGQVAGRMSAAELINAMGIAIQKRVSLTELETLQMATHPYLTAAPTMYPLVLAAQDAAGKI
ncbi:MAG: pyridine nucleotide-disulfide oxidoreductase [Candidatus Omnitrophota bacterium]|nr:MAG: pyridine nucleotide-disulfide oxidoreductase [Candidatus Omnitrophota bacterium]HEC68962.1 pyridine nucleotide-disulfide oxidoreductase [Candidatus Omnitrophota bacterium]